MLWPGQMANEYAMEERFSMGILRSGKSEIWQGLSRRAEWNLHRIVRKTVMPVQ